MTKINYLALLIIKKYLVVLLREKKSSSFRTQKMSRIENLSSFAFSLLHHDLFKKTIWENYDIFMLLVVIVLVQTTSCISREYKNVKYGRLTN